MRCHATPADLLADAYKLMIEAAGDDNDRRLLAEEVLDILRRVEGAHQAAAAAGKARRNG